MKHTFKIGYLRAILLVSCLLLGAMLAYNSLVVYPSFNQMLTENTEEESVRVASYLMAEVLGKSTSLQIDENQAVKINDALNQFKLWKLKIFSSHGLCIYSTDPAGIGKVNDSDIFKKQLPAGDILSKVVMKASKSSEGQSIPLDITETYVPLFAQGEFVGAFEIYYDITRRKAAQDSNLRKSTMVSFGIAALFFCVLGFILERAGKSIFARKIAEQRLQESQKQLLESEKMAALGGLVAGVAHEINTPVGAAVTVASTLEERTRNFHELFTCGQIKRSDLQKYFEIASTSATVILTSLRQAAYLIKSFKQVAVDQSSEEKRAFQVRQCVDDVLLTLKPQFRQNSHQVEIDCSDDLEINSYPGAMTQIVTNMVINSLSHGFRDTEEGKINISAQKSADRLQFYYSDNGAGMGQETLQKVFEPFFTTRRAEGGSGLGMHITYNLVSQKLGGEISCQSSPGQGTVFTISIPLSNGESP